MSAKTYYGLCGSCRYCELGDSYTSCYVTHFKCSRNGYSVTATERSPATNTSRIAAAPTT